VENLYTRISKYTKIREDIILERPKFISHMRRNTYSKMPNTPNVREKLMIKIFGKKATLL
jgi:hypothetical protein